MATQLLQHQLSYFHNPSLIIGLKLMPFGLGNCDGWLRRGEVKNVPKLEKILSLHPLLLPSCFPPPHLSPLLLGGGNICIVSPPPPLPSLPLNLPLNVALGNHPCPRPTRNILSHPACQQVRFIKYLPNFERLARI